MSTPQAVTTTPRAVARPEVAVYRKPVPYNRIIGRILFYLLVLVILVYTIFPFYWALRSSVSPDNELFSTPVQYWPQHASFDNYCCDDLSVFHNTRFTGALLNSLIVAASKHLAWV